MPRQHFLPAALVGRFSAATSYPVRERPVWVCRRDSAEPYVQKADNVAALEDFYTVEVSPFVGDERGARPFAIDEMWSHIEQSLNEIVDAADAAVTTRIVEAGKWAMFIEFLSQVLARTPDFDRRFAERFAGTGDLLDLAASRDNINAVRLIEIQRMRAAFLYGRWYFVRFPNESLVQNDRGYAGTADKDTGATGCLFPLRHDLAVTVLNSVEPIELSVIGDTYYVPVGSNVFDADDAASVSLLIAASAGSEIFGPSKHVVKAASSGFARERPEEGPELLFGHTSRWLRDHELDFFNFLTHIATPPCPK